MFLPNGYRGITTLPVWGSDIRIPNTLGTLWGLGFHWPCRDAFLHFFQVCHVFLDFPVVQSSYIGSASDPILSSKLT